MEHSAEPIIVFRSIVFPDIPQLCEQTTWCVLETIVQWVTVCLPSFPSTCDLTLFIHVVLFWVADPSPTHTPPPHCV